VRPQRLTVDVADDLLGQLGADGKTLYFVSNRDTTQPDLRPEHGRRPRAPLFDDGADVTWPRVSPTGGRSLHLVSRQRLGAALRPQPPGGDGREDASWIRPPPCKPSGSTPTGSRSSPPVDPGGPARPGGHGPVYPLGAALLDRNMTSPAVSPDGRWLVYVPVARTVQTVGPAFAAHAAPRPSRRSRSRRPRRPRR
jgi:hypothetical protein